jgi:hypothetical protein
MKKITLMLVLAFTIHSSNTFAFEWEEFGPPGIKANKICFLHYNATSLICTDSGTYVTDINGGFWEFYPLPIVEAVLPGYDSDTLLVIINEGSYSDGIWSFDPETGGTNIIEWCYKPNFIITNESMDKFYVGYEYGLLFSEDGLNWTDVAFFENKKCIDMEFFVVATSEENNNTYLSEDNGTSWIQLEGSNISEIANSSNSIYGIVKGGSWSSGLYKIHETELLWDICFYSVNMNAVGTSNAGTLFVGWHNGDPPDEGIAKYKNNELVLYNDGLPDLNINAISSPMIIGATVIYCCTDSGAYQRVLSVGIKENETLESLNIFPNPVTNQTTIKLNLTESSITNNSILIYNNEGLKVDEIQIEQNLSGGIETNWDKGNLPSGIYFIAIKTKNGNLSKKFIIL